MTTEIQLTSGAKETLYPVKESSKYVIYFHGGGFVYGSRHDIPQALIEVFHHANLNVIALDYLLAPNTALENIITTATQDCLELITQTIKEQPFIFCGRSAGSYLMQAVTKRLNAQKESIPKALINFYGYSDLDNIDQKRELVPQKITPDMIKTFDLTTTVWDDPTLQRSLLYYYAVQEQLLSDYYQVKNNEEAFKLSKEDILNLPPTFGSASSTDAEVPFHYSKALKRSPQDKFVAVYDLEHDFLKETTNPQVIKVFTQLAKWLESL